MGTYAHDHDRRTVDDRLVVRRDIDGGKALGEGGGDPGVARRDQDLWCVIDVLAQPRNDCRADRANTDHAVRHPPCLLSSDPGNRPESDQPTSDTNTFRREPESAS
jgi:hypothetical protein